MYDLIGDIHGQLPSLLQLLTTLGYRSERGVWRHPDRTALFLGDFVDRGPDSPGVVACIRAMTDAGAARAIMGNHEYNLLAWHALHLETGEPLRAHSERHRRQVQRTLEQYEGRPEVLASDLEWIRRLPFSLDLDGLRAVHATWDGELAAAADAARNGSDERLDDSFLSRTADPGTAPHTWIEILLKGREGLLPRDTPAVGPDGATRRRVRLRWWEDPRGRGWTAYAMQPGFDVVDGPLPDALCREARPYPADAPPVFFGHFCLNDDVPARMAPNVACVDFGAGQGWNLAAYRWSGERTLANDRFVIVPVD